MSKTKLDVLTEKILDDVVKAGFNCPMIYGSWSTFCDYKYDSKLPNDIDILNIVYDDYEQGHYTLHVKSIDIPINVENITYNRLRQELLNGEIKYYTLYYNIPTSLNHLISYYGSISTTLCHRSALEIRNLGSRASDKALNKGHKKLTVLNDYDKELGLKNLWHSIHFIHILMNQYTFYRAETQEEIEAAAFKKEFNVLTILDIRDNIYKIYEETVGGVFEKAEAVMAYVKPIHKKLMSDFRKQFPK